MQHDPAARGAAAVDPAEERLQPWLARLANWERHRPATFPFDLRAMQALLEESGPGPSPAVQVGGSKGKGTTCAFLAALTQQAGVVPGVYTSPHVATLLERICIGTAPIGVEPLAALLDDVLAAARRRDVVPTFFEAMTMAAVLAFVRHRVGLSIFEVGLGGRLDATTAIPVDASILTSIELEHTDVLGDTIAAIAAQKAPVVRPGGRGFTAATGEALDVIRRHAMAVGARLSVLGRDLRYRDERWDGTGFRAVLVLPSGAEHGVFLPDARGYEPPALALAAAVLAELLPGAPLVLEPAPRPALPARFEVLRAPDGGVVVLDGAHTGASLAAVGAELARRHPGARVAVLFGCAAGKRWQAGLSALLPIADRFVVTAPSGTVGEDPAAIAAWLGSRGKQVEIVVDAAAGLARLLALPAPRLVTGSFYLAGCVRRLLVRSQREPSR